MGINLDEIHFYHGPTRPRPSTSAGGANPRHTTTHVPHHLQQSFQFFPTGFDLHPRPFAMPSGQPRPLIGATHEWNIFDLEINNVSSHTCPEMTKVFEPPATTSMPSASNTLLEQGASARPSSGSVLPTGSANSTPYSSVPDQVDTTFHDIQGNESPDAAPETTEIETALPCVPSVAAPEEATPASSDPCVVGDFQQESATRQSSTTGFSDSPHLGESENETEPSQTSALSATPCSSVDQAKEYGRDSGTDEDHLAPSGPSLPPNMCSVSTGSRGQTKLSFDIPVRYPSIAVVVPPPSWKQGPARTSKRAAAAVCKKRLRSGRRTNHHHDGNNTDSTEQPSRKRKKRRPSDSSISAPPHRSGESQGIRGSALLTIEPNSGPNPAYFFTFVPDSNLMQFCTQAAAIPAEEIQYTSDENALLVRLKEKEAIPWSEIASHFPGRNMSSLEVHYLTKLRHKASSRSGKLRRRK
ncbi:hypothetical protein PEX1_093040 [Penicillium expansum]|nr:hypothetical protein PEX1_093040 [Penicillium expansum]